MTSLRISQLAKRSGVPATTLRFYEAAGLLPADRTPAGYRLYGEDAVERLAFIGAAKHVGLQLEHIAELLGVWESGGCADVKADLRPRIVARIADAQSRAAELAAFIATLHRTLDHLDALPDRAGRCDSECGFLAPNAPATSPIEVTARRGRQAADAERWRTAPVACSLTGDQIGERAAQWHRLTTGAERQEVPDGIRLALPADRAADLAALAAAAEQQCCPFFDFRLHLNGPVLYLEVRAPAEGAGLLAELFSPATADARQRSTPADCRS